MDYKQYSPEELATDSHFIGWIKRPDRENTAFWESWLAQNPDKREDVELARQLVSTWKVKSPPISDGSAVSVWEKIQADRTHWEAPSSKKKPSYVLHWRNYRQWAAVFTGLLFVGAVLYWKLNNWNTTSYATQVGEVKTIVLPDSSTVILNANSALSFANDWNLSKVREVELEGEAFFSVTHQTNHQKFIVNTADHLHIEVLGTTFTVSERKSKTQVVLNSGKVSLYTDNGLPPLVMKPGELVQVSNDRRLAIFRSRVNPEVYSAWKDNQFVFDNTSIGEIAAIIETNFGYQVQFADSTIKSKKMTLKVLNRDLNLLLAALAEAHDLKISRKDNQILIEDDSFAK